jgi:hypothetical protein
MKVVGFATICVALLVIGCSPGQERQSAACGKESPAIIAKREAAFSATLHPLLLAQTCNQCHAKASGKAPYFHSDGNPSVAYANARELSDFSNPGGSRLVRKLEADHNCGSDSVCHALARSAEEKIQAWAALESDLPPPPTCQGDLKSGLNILLPPKNLVPSELSKTSDTELRWDVGAVNPIVGKVFFTVKVRKYTDPSAASPGTYKISSPTLATQDLRLEVMSALVTINNSLATSYASWGNAKFVVMNQGFDELATILGFSPFSDLKMVIDWVNLQAGTTTPTGDSLGFQLRVRETNDPPSAPLTTLGCKAKAEWDIAYASFFDEKILAGGNYVGRCTQCHGDTTQPANIAMNLSSISNDPCFEALRRADLNNFNSSLIVLKPSQRDYSAAYNNGEKHPVLIDVYADPQLAGQRNKLYQWLQKEKDELNKGN